MGHVCETRANPHPTQTANAFKNAYKAWVANFLPLQRIIDHWGEKKFDRFTTRIATVRLKWKMVIKSAENNLL